MYCGRYNPFPQRTMTNSESQSPALPGQKAEFHIVSEVREDGNSLSPEGAGATLLIVGLSLSLTA